MKLAACAEKIVKYNQRVKEVGLLVSLHLMELKGLLKDSHLGRARKYNI